MKITHTDVTEGAKIAARRAEESTLRLLALLTFAAYTAGMTTIFVGRGMSSPTVMRKGLVAAFGSLAVGGVCAVVFPILMGERAARTFQSKHPTQYASIN